MTDHQFQFIETQVFSLERQQMGWKREEDIPYVTCFEENRLDCAELLDADYVLFGGAPRQLIEQRLKKHKLVFKYSERVFKHGYDRRKWLPRVLRYWWFYTRHRSLYLLCASGYTAADFARHRAFLGKSYKWGYFPETRHYDVERLLAKKEPNRILWCGRFLDWKHPEAALETAWRLKAAGYKFQLDMIGTGELEPMLREQIKTRGLSDCVTLLGSMSPDRVRQHMERAGIFLFTSDFGEGWGAVVNESMNSGCAVVASHAAGAVPFLIKHKENGIVYQSGDQDALYTAVKQLLDQPSEQARLGRLAYAAIAELWNAEVAAKRFLILAQQIQEHGYCDLFEEGPCSRAFPLRNDWFKSSENGRKKNDPCEP